MEDVRIHHPNRSRLTIQATILLITSLFVSPCLLANPVLNNIESGQVTVNQTTTTTTVNQSSDKAILNWNSFNIGAGETTRFNQPSASSVALNRINPNQGVSQIYGSLSSNGQIILINQAGIHFGPGSTVDVAGMIASTTDMSSANFLAGNNVFDQPSSTAGTIINEGTIIAANNGLIALIGNNVENNGTITAELGNIVLASGQTFTMTFSGDQLINFSVNSAITTSGTDQYGNTMTDGVKNSGSIIADGGTIQVSAEAAAGVLDNIINMTGIAEANSVSSQNGEIILGTNSTGVTHISGSLTAQGLNTSETGGIVEIAGDQIQMDPTGQINVNGIAGGGIIDISGNTLNLTGTLSAQGQSSGETGGTVNIAGDQLQMNTTGQMNASGTSGGGNINISVNSMALASLVATGGNGTINLYSTDSISQNTGGGGIQADNLNVSNSSGPVTLTDPNNQITNNLTLETAGETTLTTNSGLNIGYSQTGGDLMVSSQGNITLSGAVSVTGNATVISTGIFNLDNTVTATGNINLVAGTQFINNTGGSALNPGSGYHFLVWSGNTSPFSGTTADVRDGLTANFVQYNATYGVTTVADSIATDSGFLYTLAPEITPTLTGTVTNIYSATTTLNNLTAANYSFSGAINGDTISFANLPTAGTYASKNVGTDIAVTSASSITLPRYEQNGSEKIYGYTLASTSASGNIGIITPATLTYTANPDAMLQGSKVPPLSGTVSGLVGGETEATATTGTATWSTNATSKSPAGSYDINGSGLTANNGNYLFVEASSNATAMRVLHSDNDDSCHVDYHKQNDDHSRGYDNDRHDYPWNLTGFDNFRGDIDNRYHEDNQSVSHKS